MKVKVNKTTAGAMLEDLIGLQDDLVRRKQETGILELEEEIADLRAKITEYMRSKNVDILHATGASGKYARLVQAVKSKWIGYQKDIPPDAPAGTQSLRSLVDRATWMKLTRRVPDSSLIENAVAKDETLMDRIQAAYVEIPSKPYVRIYDEVE
jgi:hypothetical protein